MKRYIHYGHTQFNKDKFTFIKNALNNTKPIGELWASDVGAEYGWKDWCKDNDFRDCKKKIASLLPCRIVQEFYVSIQ